MHLYHLFMDSAKLFFLNVFLYTLFLELYLISSLLEARYSLELSFATVFVSGVFTFIAISIWLNAAHVWYGWIKSTRELVMRALLSEAPFILLFCIFLLLRMGMELSASVSGEVATLFLLFSGYFIAFPAIMGMSKKHHEQVAAL